MSMVSSSKLMHVCKPILLGHRSVLGGKQVARLCTLHSFSKGSGSGRALCGGQPLLSRPIGRRHQQQVRAASGEAASGNGADREYDYDLFTIGAGSGGVRASRFATQYGAKVAICEMPFNVIASDKAGGAGGTCVLRGCVPKKLMVFGGEFAEAFKDSVGFGWDASVPEHTWDRLMANKDKELDRLNGVYMKILKNAGVEFIEGRGKIVDAHTVDVDGKRYTAKNILIATGGRAVKLPIEGAEHAIISDQVLALPNRPKKMAVIGGGYIAVEFAGIYNNFGTEVHLMFRQKLPLGGFDTEVREFALDQYKQKGLNIHAEANPSKIVKNEDGTLTLFAKGPGGEEFAIENCDQVLMATGRKPNVQNMGLEEVGVKMGKGGAIVVNEYSQTAVDSIYAVGDVTDRINLTPVALMEGGAFARNVFNGEDVKPDYEAVASAVFSSPPIATVGLTEEQAHEKYGDIDIYSTSFKPMKNTISGSESRTLMKIIVDPESDLVLGVHMMGPDCAEIIQGFAVALKMGVTKKKLDSVVGVHPTSAEEFVTMRSVTRKVRKDAPVPASA